MFHQVMLNQVRAMIDDQLMWAFTLAIIFDLITGTVKPYFAKDTAHKTNSTTGRRGLIKNAVIYIAVATLYPYLNAIGAGAMANTVVIGFIYQYLISIAENWQAMGWWLPNWLDDFLSRNLAKSQLDFNPSQYDIFGKFVGTRKVKLIRKDEDDE
ncbi:Phage-related holin (lysis protein) [Ligilactobacillus saerimneri 30a]|uniref:Phage-related holin (Lysis protein) n=2 Tax=Ligilactobacillus saerimneri TaxID=228229 RepID=M5J7Z5_9LACO|nr:Phage-related holin (lysis protein) [Ligilactobacillus saerimneri 30a]